MLGVFGKYLDIDLRTKSCRDYHVPDDWYLKHIGGRGIAARILLKEIAPKIDPFSEENPLVFASGPFQGLNIAGGSRFLVMAKSPKTRTLNDSYCGGRFGHELGRSGFDGIIVRGRSEEPVYILVVDGEVGIHSAKELWGLDVKQTEEFLESKYGKLSVASIGKAGENLVMMAAIMVDHNRAVARPGFGALMGSKNLKAIAMRGNIEKPVADKGRLESLRATFAKEIMLHDWPKTLHDFGTGGGVSYLSQNGLLPTKNFTTGFFLKHEKICGRRTNENGMLVRMDTCPGCPVRCKRGIKGSFNGQEIDPTWGGPEYETYGSLGSLCLVEDISAICLLNQKCNQYGIDTVSFGVVAAYLMEATEKGLLEGANAIQWGDAEAMDELLDRIAHRKGIGEWVAQGLSYLGSKVGDASFLVQCKGQEVPMHDPRGRRSMALYYSISPRGANHMEGTLDAPFPNEELGLGENDMLTWDNRAKIAGAYLNLRSFGNSLILCSFVTDLAGPGYMFPMIREMLEAACGIAVNVEEMMKIGERNFGLLRIFAEREGFSRADDDLPPRFKERLPESGHYVDDHELQKAIDDYYRIYAFQPYGPSNERLEALGLKELRRQTPS
jgi:aldehyde:ferredoxin oxidoreductase